MGAALVCVHVVEVSTCTCATSSVCGSAHQDDHLAVPVLRVNRVSDRPQVRPVFARAWYVLRGSGGHLSCLWHVGLLGKLQGISGRLIALIGCLVTTDFVVHGHALPYN